MINLIRQRDFSTTFGLLSSNGGGVKEIDRDIRDYVKNEMPQETFLEQALFCCGYGADLVRKELLSLAPQTAEILYHRAYIREWRRTKLKLDEQLSEANAASPYLVFPHRPESIKVFEWAIANSKSWKPKYYLALIYWSRDNYHQSFRII